MEHISDALRVKVDKFVPDIDKLRRALPVLGQATDAAILEKYAELHFVSEIAERCKGCTGFMSCWREEEGRGEVRVVHVNDGRVTIRSAICKPCSDYHSLQRHLRLVEQSGMDGEARMLTFDNFPEEQAQLHTDLYQCAKEFADQYQEGPAKGIYIFGDPGIAKTHLMYAMINRLVDRGVRAIAIRADVLMDKLRAAQRKEGEHERLLELYGTVPVLGIDEFAQERPKEFTVDMSFRILSDRAQKGLATFFTSNYPPLEAYKNVYAQDELSKKIDPLRSRILRVATPALMQGRDHRLKDLQILTPRKLGS